MRLFDSIFWIPLWLTGFVVTAAILLAQEIGYRSGLKYGERQEREQQVVGLGTIQAAVLGLLGLLLAFTYSLASGRYDTRKHALVSEANAIGTAYLRCDLLPNPVRGGLRQVYREYVGLRISPEGSVITPEWIRQWQDNTARKQAQIWSLAMRGVEMRGPDPVSAGIVNATNDVIDLHTTRWAAYRDHVPPVVLFLVLLVAVLSVALTGFNCGLSRSRSTFFTMTLCVLIVAVILVIIDLDRAHRGLIQIDQQCMIDLQNSIEADFARPATQP